MNVLLDMLSKKQPTQVFLSDQKSHFVMAEAFQKAKGVEQLITWLDSQTRAPVVNYDWYLPSKNIFIM